ncbi:MAG TPA: hypothetical protein VGP08_02320 [Pyrinomonadaceae bacterium]|jgi:hypothetical protein|nr:hypothetical protein [Pyrinomonadaceae bacterium]
MPAKNTTRDGRATRIPAEPEIEQVITLLDDDATTHGQRNLINATLRELSDETDVRLPKQGADPRDFYLEAAYSLGAAGPRARLRETLALIAGGERFDDYKKGDQLYLWKTKRARRKHSGTTSTAAELERRLADPKTPADYHAALKRALRALCDATGSRYNAKDPAWTYAESQAEAEKFSVIGDRGEWEARFDARNNLLALLEGLRKRRPFSSVRLKGARRKQEQEHGGADDPPPRLASLRNALRRLTEEGEAHNESAAFLLKREIYDLEHRDTTPGSEWPDWIPG